MSEEKTTEYVLKLVVLGDAAVGKTSLINQYIEHSFKEDYKPTLGVNIVTKNVPIKNHSNAIARLVLWDLAAQTLLNSLKLVQNTEIMSKKRLKL